MARQDEENNELIDRLVAPAAVAVGAIFFFVCLILRWRNARHKRKKRYSPVVLPGEQKHTHVVPKSAGVDIISRAKFQMCKCLLITDWRELDTEERGFVTAEQQRTLCEQSSMDAITKLVRHEMMASMAMTDERKVEQIDFQRFMALGSKVINRHSGDVEELRCQLVEEWKLLTTQALFGQDWVDEARWLEYWERRNSEQNNGGLAGDSNVRRMIVREFASLPIDEEGRLTPLSYVEKGMHLGKLGKARSPNNHSLLFHRISIRIMIGIASYIAKQACQHAIKSMGLATKSAQDVQLHKGDLIEVTQIGLWFRGTVQAVRGGSYSGANVSSITYDVQYDDYTSEKGVEIARVRNLPHLVSASALKKQEFLNSTGLKSPKSNRTKAGGGGAAEQLGADQAPRFQAGGSGADKFIWRILNSEWQKLDTKDRGWLDMLQVREYLERWEEKLKKTRRGAGAGAGASTDAGADDPEVGKMSAKARAWKDKIEVAMSKEIQIAKGRMPKRVRDAGAMKQAPRVINYHQFTRATLSRLSMNAMPSSPQKPRRLAPLV